MIEYFLWLLFFQTWIVLFCLTFRMAHKFIIQPDRVKVCERCALEVQPGQRAEIPCIQEPPQGKYHNYIIASLSKYFFLLAVFSSSCNIFPVPWIFIFLLVIVNILFLLLRWFCFLIFILFALNFIFAWNFISPTIWKRLACFSLIFNLWWNIFLVIFIYDILFSPLNFIFLCCARLLTFWICFFLLVIVIIMLLWVQCCRVYWFLSLVYVCCGWISSIYWCFVCVY